MSNYVAIKSEASLWTVGSYDENGRFDPIEDFSSAIDAQDLRDILNSPVRIMQMIKKTEQQQAKIERLNADNQKLSQVANMAAFCVIDLSCNLKEAYKEYMAGDIARGAYNHVLDRHGSLLATLADAGYTEKHKIYDFPVKPLPKGDQS